MNRQAEAEQETHGLVGWRWNTMLPFDGHVQEYPALSVDNFSTIRTQIKAFFLSHIPFFPSYPTDDAKGLDNPHFHHPIYCSEITARLLPRLQIGHNAAAALGVRTCAHLEPWLRPIPLLTPTCVELDDGRNVIVTLLPSNYCSGAVMFLFEGDKGAVLYTGDFRADPAFLADLSACDLLTDNSNHNKVGLCSVDRIYLDTTFCHEHYETFSPKKRSLDALIAVINSYPPDTVFYLDCWYFGYEEIWKTVAQAFDTKIHVSPYVYSLYAALHPMVSHLLDILTISAATRFHACDLTLGIACVKSTARRVVSVRPGATSWVRTEEKEKSSKGKAVAGGVWDLYKDCLRREPVVEGRECDEYVSIFFPTHSSLSELRSFVRLFSPRSIFPTVLDHDHLTCPNVVTRFRDLLSHGEEGGNATRTKANKATAVVQGSEQEQEEGKKREIGRLEKNLLENGGEAEGTPEKGYEGGVELGTEKDGAVEAMLTNTTTTSVTDITMQSLDSVRGGEDGEDRESYPSALEIPDIVCLSQDSVITIVEEHSHALMETSEDDDDCRVVKQVAMRKETRIVSERGYSSQKRTTKQGKGGTLLDPIMVNDDDKEKQQVKRKRKTLTMREAKAEISEWVKRLRRACPEPKGSADTGNARAKEVIVVDDLLDLELDPVERETTPLVLSDSSSVESAPIALLSPTLSSPSNEPGPLVLEQDSESSQSADMELVERIRNESEATGMGPLLDCCRR